jgi:hypothetical protein
MPSKLHGPSASLITANLPYISLAASSKTIKTQIDGEGEEEEEAEYSKYIQ